MKNRISPTRRQGGFIQGTILFALAILGIIIAAFAVSNTGSSTNTDSERARVNAGVVMKAGSDIQDAVSRALADQHLAGDITLLAGTTTALPVLYLFDNDYRYGSAPRLPEQAFAGSASLPFEEDDADSIAGDATLNDLLIKLPGLREDVCRRINNLALGGPFDASAIPATSIDAAVTAGLTSEGCYNDATDGFTYFRVVAVDI